MLQVVLEKRIGIAQLVLLSTVLIFMALTRGSRGDPVVESARIFKSLRREAGSGFYRGLRTSNEWVSSFRIGGVRAISGPGQYSHARVLHQSLPLLQMKPPRRLYETQGHGLPALRYLGADQEVEGNPLACGQERKRAQVASAAELVVIQKVRQGSPVSQNH